MEESEQIFAHRPYGLADFRFPVCLRRTSFLLSAFRNSSFIHCIMARQFKTVRFFVLMALAPFLVCGAVAFFTERATHGQTDEERAAYALYHKTHPTP